MVLVNIRLNAFGFLGSGNYGLLDLTCALEWARLNIADFGGDPARITCLGSNAGAAMIHYLMLFGATGLMDRAVLMTGTVGSAPPKSVRTSERVVKGMCEILGFSGNSEKEMTDFLRSTSTEKLLDSLARLKSRDRELYSTAFYPTIDGDFVSGDYRSLEASGAWDPSVREVIVGCCEGAGEVYFTRGGAKDVDRFNDAVFAEPCDFTAASLAQGQSPVVGKYVWSKLLRRTELLGNATSHHAMEVPFIFLSSLLSPGELELAKQVVARWVAFAESGEVWARYEVGDEKVLFVGADGVGVGKEKETGDGDRRAVRMRAKEQSKSVAAKL